MLTARLTAMGGEPGPLCHGWRTRSSVPGACWDSSHLFLLEPEARFLSLLSSVDDGDGRWRRRAACIHSRCERPRPARPFTCVPSHACSHCPSKRAALYPIRLHSLLPYACKSIHARCEWPRLVLACTPCPSMHASPLMRAAAYSTHVLSLPSHACDRIHHRLRSDLLRVLSYSGSWIWDFQIPLWL